MQRGELFTVAGGGEYARKPRPAVIVQNDGFDATNSIVVCPLTTSPSEAALFRLRIEPSDANGLKSQSRIMVDKVAAVPRAKLGVRIGRLDDADILRLNQALLVFLGLAGPTR
jgi:mRNA interferase MazF